MNTKKSWIKTKPNDDFSLHNIPFGIAESKNKEAFVATRIGDTVISLAAMNRWCCFGNEIQQKQQVFESRYLNDFIALGKETTSEIRNTIIELFAEDEDALQGFMNHPGAMFHDISDVKMLMPVKVGDYTDFYSSKEHATNVGIMFRDPENALLPNWKHIPVGYHGRASSIVVSGTDIHRPKGQTKPDNAEKPVFGPSRLMDFELEMAFITNRATRLGESIPVDKAEDYIFGMVIFNDLSARDIQKWEYVPLGPFLSKSFGSVISPWVVTLEALEPFRTSGPLQDVEVLPYLQLSGNKSFDINLEVLLQPEGSEAKTVCRSNFRHLYWSMSQQLAHHTVNGCNINVGDMYASGTISGPDPGSFGSLLEISWKGTKPIDFPDGMQRKFIENNDTVIMRAFAEKDGMRVGFGESVTKILPAI
jgi:fumarylacetoacetase